MKNLFLSAFLILICSATQLYAQVNKTIVGVWWNQEKDAKIEVFEKNGKFYGKIIWLEKDYEDDGSKPNLDDKNPEKELQKRPVLGLQILSDLVWDEDDNEWDDGNIYDPKSGNTYSCYATLDGNDKINLRGYIGFSLIGRTSVWTRVK